MSEINHAATGVLMLGRRAIVVAIVVLIMVFATALAAHAEAAQLGTTSTTSGTAAGVSSTITQPNVNYHYAQNNPVRFYWPGFTLRDGHFLQAGYEDPGADSGCSTCCPGFEWFVDNFDATGAEYSRQDGGCGTTGTRTFALANFGQDPITELWNWHWRMNASDIGNPYYSSASVGNSNTAGVISEISSVAPFDYQHPFGMALTTFAPTIRIRLSDGTWKDLNYVTVLREDDPPYTGKWTHCPPYNIRTNAVESVSTGDSFVSCLTNGSPLWQ